MYSDDHRCQKRTSYLWDLELQAIPNISAQIGTLIPMIEQQVLLITEPSLQSEAGVLRRPLRFKRQKYVRP